MSEDREGPLPRDQVPTEFAAVLRRLVRSIPGAVGAAFCDFEGESVDFYGDVDPFDLKIAGAQFAPIHEEIVRRLRPAFGLPVIHLRGESASYLYVPVADEYYVIAVLSAFASWWEALEDVEAARLHLKKEAGL
jgi:hypothetical protein